jgi:predicted transcriptional regulator
MDKILSARVDESIIHRIGVLARQLHTSKKRIIEEAIQSYADQLDQKEQCDVFARTCGAWNREESASEIVAEARETFRKSMERHRS